MHTAFQVPPEDWLEATARSLPPSSGPHSRSLAPISPSSTASPPSPRRHPPATHSPPPLSSVRHTAAPPRRPVHTSAAATRDPCPQLDDGTWQCALAQDYALVTCRQPDLLQSQRILGLHSWTKTVAAAPREQDTRRHNNNCLAIASHDCRRSALVIPAKHNMERC